MNYYKTIKKIGDTTNIAYWKTKLSVKAQQFFASHAFDFVIPYGNKKPRNIPAEQFNII